MSQITKTTPHRLIAPAVEVVSVPETPLVALDEANRAPLVLEVRLPHQRAVPEDPQAALPRDDVLRLHCDVRMDRWVALSDSKLLAKVSS